MGGFVEIKPGHSGGSFVSKEIYKPLFDSIYDLFLEGDLTLQHFVEVRVMAECYSVLSAMDKLRQEDIEQLEMINAHLIEKERTAQTFHAGNMDFHLKIAEISGNPLIKLIVGALLRTLKTSIFIDPSQRSHFIEATYERHLRIISALKQGDRRLCRKLITLDIEYTKELAGNPR